MTSVFPPAGLPQVAAMLRNSLKMLLTGGKTNRKSRSSGESEQHQRPLWWSVVALPLWVALFVGCSSCRSETEALEPDSTQWNVLHDLHCYSM